MKRLIFLIPILLLAADKKPPVDPQHLPGDEPDEYICRINSFHHCHCPMAVAEDQQAVVEKCLNETKGQKDYILCLKKNERSECEIVKTADSKHPDHTCKRTCKTARCACHDGPVCRGPALTEVPDGGLQ